ncbi:SDR family oxidoreductase [Dyadobacter pollutisoli]|uniref:SDR family oxidoreductase n=1 Tax=Dyadobacter pollutisoli TaxID=2910158 RepID=A0A9E8NBI9_9BACT|nr:SDR family oxidoreductase [Dyadobacter pollutisoli]WAC11516.1 SDR family oxidoreductase [Dyadobacter pollutisoli]
MEQKSEPLQNKKIVIIGGSAGIGFAVAQAVAAKQAHVVIVSSNQERVNKALETLPENSAGYAVDVTNETQIQQLFETIGPFDHLVYTAGENLMLGNVSDTDVAGARKFWDIRYWGAFAAVKHASTTINPGGSMVLTSGIASNRPNAGWALGASICAAMEGFTRAMAMELAPVRVNIVSPGVVTTDLWSNMPVSERDGFYASVAGSLPVKHVGQAEEIARAYVYLMEQTFGTGQTVVVDGGGVLV